MTVSILDPLMAAANTLRAADKIPQYKAVLDAYQRIAELQVQTDERKATITKLSEELELMRNDQASTEGSEVWLNLKWLKGDNNPRCLYCWEKLKRLYSVHSAYVPPRGNQNQCPECETVTPYYSQPYWLWKASQEQKNAVQ